MPKLDTAALEVTETDGVTVHRLACSLNSAADRLESAGTARDFVSALEANGCVWSEVRRMAPKLGWTLPQRTMQLSLAGADMGIDDHHVEAIITVNRRLSREILG